MLNALDDYDGDKKHITYDQWVENESHNIFILEKELGFPISSLDGLQVVERMRQFIKMNKDYDDKKTDTENKTDDKLNKVTNGRTSKTFN